MTTISKAQQKPAALATQANGADVWRMVLLRTVQYGLLCLLALFMLLPLLWMLSSSLKLRSQVFAFPPQWIPDPLVWSNYGEAWTAYPFNRFMFNSLKVAILSVLGQLLICSMGGYGFARFQFPLKNVFFTLLIAVMLVPGIVNVVPLFILYKNLGWLDTHLPLIVPTVFANTFGTFLFRQFMLTIPKDLEDAALIDGAGAWAIYWRIMLPLCKSAAAVLATFTFIASWNNFFAALIYLQSQEQFTMPIGLSYFRSQVGTAWNLLMAGSAISMVPTILVFLFTQKYFVRGITMSGLKF
jgi:multiple sugar transport system permease protein